MENTIETPKVLSLQRVGGMAFMFGNLLFLVNKLDEMSRVFLSRPMPDVISGANPFLILIGQVALITGYVAFLKVYLPRAGKFAGNMLRVFCYGGIVLAVSHVGFSSAFEILLPRAIRPYAENFFLLVALGMLLMIPGLILFGITNLHTPVMSRWSWLPLATGGMGLLGFFLFSGAVITAPFLLFRTLFAIGLIGLGLILWLEKPA